MKFSIAALALAVTSAWASPVTSDTPVNDIVADIKARTGAFYFHAGSDHVLRAISTEFEVLESAPLTERQVADYNAGLGQTFAKRDDSVVDERELLETLEAKMRRESAEEIFKVEARQTCSGPSCDRRHCPSSCGCRCSGGQFEVCWCV